MDNNFKKNDIILIPLAAPNGIYIRLLNKETNNYEKIPVLGRILDFINNKVKIINYFGYIYDVPYNHIITINNNIKDKYYTDMINYAYKVLKSKGYDVYNNNKFYMNNDESNENNKLIEYLLENKIVLNNKGSPINIKLIKTDYESNFDYSLDDNDSKIFLINSIMDNYNNGTVNIINTKNKLIHIITSTRKKIIYDSDRKILQLNGYSKNIIDKIFTYRDMNGKKFSIFKSNHNYYHIPFDNLMIVNKQNFTRNF
jgi:hypothetical protein